MKIEDIVALAKAGFTYDQIQQILHSSKQSTSDAPAEDPKPASSAPEKQPAAQSPAPDHTVGNAEVLKAIKDLTTSIQANAILHSSQPETAKPEQSAEEILIESLFPTKK